jgi:DNA-binding NarL/FixJ family response regulator
MIRVLVADDHALVRGGFTMILSAQPDIDVVGEARDGVEVLELAASLRPDVVLMDIRMPRQDGISATAALLAAPGLGDTKVLVLTTFDLDRYVYAALKSGAAGFLVKDEPPERLVEAVRTVARGESLLSQAVLLRLVERFVDGPAPDTAPAPPPGLTEREVDVLAKIGRGMTNQEIATELFLSETTVKSHVRHVFGKLGLRDRAQAVVAAYECGLVTPGAVAPTRDAGRGRIG